MVSFSGGKDSMASWLYLERELGLEVEIVFADTGHEADGTNGKPRDLLDYLEYLEERLGRSIVRVQGTMRQLGVDSDDPLTMESLCKHKGTFPSRLMRFCTTQLKLVPFKAHLDRRRAEEPETRFVVVSGVRREESPKRAAITEARGRDDFMDADRWLPLLDWTVEEVFRIHFRHGVSPNPLYLQGMGRVGCFPCIMASKPELGQIARQFPAVFDNVERMEAEVRKSPRNPGLAFFFAHTKTAKRYRAKVGTYVPRSGPFKGKTRHLRYASAGDVRRWALGAFPADTLFAKLPMVQEPEPDTEDLEGPACSSIYGLCE